MSENPHNDSRQYDDEISLYDKYRILAEKKVLVVSTIIVTLLVAIAYLYIVPPTYEAQLRLLPPTPSTLVLSIPSHPYTEFDAEAVFQGFQAHLRSVERWRQFVAASPELFSPETRSISNSLLDHPIKFSKDKNYPAEHVDLAFQHEESSATSLILSGYLQFSRNKYVSDLINQVNDRIARQRENISAEIDMLRQKKRLQREGEIERLRQDINLAKALGIVDNLLIWSVDAAGSGSDITLIATNEIMRSYMRGTRVLNAELEALLKRESDDPYIYGLHSRQVELERLDTLQVSPSRFKPYGQDGDIVHPERPIKPRKARVLVLSLSLGVLLGMMLAFLANAIQNARMRQ
jgi:chain length determinant protein (polysaccharide antigen chain regulator)